MDWIKLDTRYYNEPALMRAGEAAEILYLRGMAYAGDQETGGIVHTEVLARLTPTKATARARALVAAGLWEVVPDGWLIVGWDQVDGDELERRRAANRDRQRRFRGRQATPPDGSNALQPPLPNAAGDAQITGPEEEGELEAAAAAACDESDLPTPVVILRDKLRAHTALQRLRFDRLTPAHVDQLLALLEVHGTPRLVQLALDSYRPPGPTFAQGFIGTWQACPAPGQTLASVHAVERCPVAGHDAYPAANCPGCATDARAAN